MIRIVRTVIVGGHGKVVAKTTCEIVYHEILQFVLDLLNPADSFIFLLISFFTDSVELLDLVLSGSFLLQRFFETDILIAKHVNFPFKFINDTLVMLDVILAVHEALFIL
jgi:hypothetical protein